MEFFKPGLYLNVMQYRRYALTASAAAALGSIVLMVAVGPSYGTDFQGGTEVQLQFRGHVGAAELRRALTGLGYQGPDVVSVEGGSNEYIVRVAEVTSLPPEQVKRIRDGLRQHLQGARVKEMRVSPGGDKISLRLSAETTPEVLAEALTAAGARVRGVVPFGRAGDYRYEAMLTGVADEMLRGLAQKLGRKAPDAPRRVEWVGPKAGAQLRDAGIKSLLYAIALIMVYVAFRFDLRFAPGGVIALLHDALITVGVLVIIRKEVNLTTVAAILAVIGYSINDTIVVYDRIRENMARMRDKSLVELINLSASQTLGRTVMTSATTLLSISAFFFLGTPVIRDFAFVLFVGILIGTYSSLFVAAPITEWMDRRVFSRR